MARRAAARGNFHTPDPTDPEVITTSPDEETGQACVPMDTSDSD